MMKYLLSLFFLFFPFALSAQEYITIVSYNVENLFDTEHDTLKNDHEFLPQSPRHWTRTKYWTKLNRLGQAIVSCTDGLHNSVVPDIVGLCEVENDTTLRDLTERSLLRKAKYKYIMTNSPDERGMDVALLYSPFSFSPIHVDTLHIPSLKDMKPTRDILYVAGEILTGDTLHIFMLHAPSRSGGEFESRPFRLHVIKQLSNYIQTLFKQHPQANIIVMGDFNDYKNDASLHELYALGLLNISTTAESKNGAKGTYKYNGLWESLDHILISPHLKGNVTECRINDPLFLLEPDEKYGKMKPKRFYSGMRYNGGTSDHLPLVLQLFFVSNNQNIPN